MRAEQGTASVHVQKSKGPEAEPTLSSAHNQSRKSKTLPNSDALCALSLCVLARRNMVFITISKGLTTYKIDTKPREG